MQEGATAQKEIFVSFKADPLLNAYILVMIIIIITIIIMGDNNIHVKLRSNLNNLD